MSDKDRFADVDLIDLEYSLTRVQAILEQRANPEPSKRYQEEDLESQLEKAASTLREDILIHVESPLYQVIRPASDLNPEQTRAAVALRDSLQELSNDSENKNLAAKCEDLLRAFERLLDPDGAEERQKARELRLEVDGDHNESNPKGLNSMQRARGLTNHETESSLRQQVRKRERIAALKALCNDEEEMSDDSDEEIGEMTEGPQDDEEDGHQSDTTK